MRVLVGHPLKPGGPTLLHLREGTQVIAVRAMQPDVAATAPIILYALEPVARGPMEERQFVCLAAGADVEESHQYLDTIVLMNGTDVRHVFEKRAAGGGNA
jgi:hypothetical protein